HRVCAGHGGGQSPAASGRGGSGVEVCERVGGHGGNPCRLLPGETLPGTVPEHGVLRQQIGSTVTNRTAHLRRVRQRASVVPWLGVRAPFSRRLASTTSPPAALLAAQSSRTTRIARSGLP